LSIKDLLAANRQQNCWDFTAFLGQGPGAGAGTGTGGRDSSFYVFVLGDGTGNVDFGLIATLNSVSLPWFDFGLPEAFKWSIFQCLQKRQKPFKSEWLPLTSKKKTWKKRLLGQAGKVAKMLTRSPLV
jgi:hypothetical protein